MRALGLGFGSPFRLRAAGAGGAPSDLALDLDFTTMTSLDPRVTFTRAGPATVYGSDGLLRNAPHNICLQSQTFETSWALLGAGTTRSVNVAVAPDGTTTADQVTAAAVAEAGLRLTNVLFTAAVYTVSCYMKSAGTGFGRMRNHSSGAVAYFNLSTGAASVTGSGTVSAENVGNGWWRCILISTCVTTNIFDIGVSTAAGNPATAGGESVYIWGAQVEQHSSARPYIPTTTAAVHGPRFDYDPVTHAARGLLIEEQRINTSVQSEDLSHANWVKTNATITVDAIAAPNDALTADLLTSTSTAIFGVSTSNLWTAAPTTISAFVKKGTTGFVWARLQDSGFTSNAYFNLDTGAWATTTGYTSTTVEVLPNGWYRLSVTRTPAAGTSNAVWGFSTADNATTTVVGATGYVWGAQAEVGAFPTSYIPTTTASVTRPADTVTMTGTNFSSWYNQTEGTMVLAASTAELSTTTYFYDVVNTAANTNRVIAYPTAANIFQIRVDEVGGIQAQLLAGVALVPYEIFKSAVGLKLNDMAHAVNGALGTPDTTALMPASPCDKLNIGRNQTAVGYLKRGWVRRLTYYNTRKTNAELQALTAPAAALDLDFTTGTLDPRVTFARAGTATYYNSAGVLSTAATNTARFDHDPVTLQPRGLLLEEQRTNLLMQSSGFTAPWAIYASGGSLLTIIGTGAAPDGTGTATHFQATRAGTGEYAEFYQTISAGSSAVHTASIWLKAYAAGDVGKKITFAVNNGPTFYAIQIVTLTADWVRYTITGARSGLVNDAVLFGMVAGAGTAPDTGTIDFWAWGAQLELGTFATSYIPTINAAVTRAADSASMTGVNFSSWYNASEGTFVLALVNNNPAFGTPHWINVNLSSNPGANRFVLYNYNNDDCIFYVQTPSGTQGPVLGALAAPYAVAKIAMAVRNNDPAGCLNGGTVMPAPVPTIHIPNRLFFGTDENGAVNLVSAHYRRLTYYNTRKTNAELQALTT